MSGSFELDSVDRFIVGAVGVPGDRTFFFQVCAGKSIVSFKCEKGHVAALSDALSKMLADLPPAVGDVDRHWGSLDLPVFAEWDVGAIGLGYDGNEGSIVIVLNELDRSGGGDDDLNSARFRLTQSQAQAFAAHGMTVVAAGRPTCSLCATPIDPEGYNCPCYN